MHSVSHEDIILALSWAPNGKRLVSASWDKTVAVWEIPTGTQLVGMQNPLGWITTVAWSPGSDEIAFGGYDQDIHIYNGGVTGKAVKKLEGHTDWIQSLDWSPPNGKYLASSGHDRAIYIWDLEAEKVIQTLVGGKNVVTVVQWSPCGRYLAGGSHSGTVRIWDVQSGEILFTYAGDGWGLKSLAWSPRGGIGWPQQSIIRW